MFQARRSTWLAQEFWLVGGSKKQKKGAGQVLESTVLENLRKLPTQPNPFATQNVQNAL